MKKLSSPLKRTTVKLVSLLAIFGFFFSACKKNAIDENLSQTDPAIQKVSNWVEAQKTGKSETGIAKIQTVADAMNLSALRKENLNDKETMLIVPLYNSFTSKFNNSKNPVNVLLLIENEFGVIRRGNIVQFVPPSGAN